MTPPNWGDTVDPTTLPRPRAVGEASCGADGVVKASPSYFASALDRWEFLKHLKRAVSLTPSIVVLTQTDALREALTAPLPSAFTGLATPRERAWQVLRSANWFLGTLEELTYERALAAVDQAFQDPYPPVAVANPVVSMDAKTLSSDAKAPASKPRVGVYPLNLLDTAAVRQWLESVYERSYAAYVTARMNKIVLTVGFDDYEIKRYYLSHSDWYGRWDEYSRHFALCLFPASRSALFTARQLPLIASDEPRQRLLVLLQSQQNFVNSNAHPVNSFVD